MSSGARPYGSGMYPGATGNGEEVSYRTYDGRLVSKKVIDRVLRDLEAKERRRRVLYLLRTWGALAVLGAVMLVLTVVLTVNYLPLPHIL